MGCALLDFGDTALALPFIREAIALYSLNSPHINSAERDLSRSRAYKHLASGLLTVDRSTTASSLAAGWLADAEAVARDFNNGQAISSAKLVQAFQSRRDLDWDQLGSLAQEGMRYKDQNDALSNAMWNYLLGCYWEERKKQPLEASQYYDTAYKQYHDAHLMCQPIPTCGGFEVADPSSALLRLGHLRTRLKIQPERAFDDGELRMLFAAATAR